MGLAAHKVELFEIAHQMKSAKFSDEFIADAIETALKYDGVSDLLLLWRDETDPNEKKEIIADIQDLIDDAKQNSLKILSTIKMNDLDTISRDIRAFKDSLLEVVNQHGGITKLAKLTGIPQPSLSRFFNSNAMPRRTTLLKIANALNLKSIDINKTWSQ